MEGTAIKPVPITGWTRACFVAARQNPLLFCLSQVSSLAILVFQYDGYEAGAGKVFWVKDRDGVEVPVVSARYSIWSHTNARARSGTPAKVAREIRLTVESARPGESPRYDWVIAHVWCWFKSAPGSDETVEDMPQKNAAAQGGLRAVT